MLIPEAIEKAGKELLEKAIVEGGRAMADKAGLDYDRLVSELTHMGEATYKEMPEIARNIRAEMREAIDRKIADELERELPDGVNQLDELYTEYLSEPMETYAHMQQAYLELMLQGMEKEYAASAA